MKAYLVEGIGKLEYKEVSRPETKEQEVLVKVKAAGICGSDIPRIFETGTYHFPTIPGHEFSGQIVENGKRVGIFPLIPCGSCPACQKKQYEMCTNYNYLGSRCDGGFAECVAVPEKNLIEIPDNISYKEAAMLEPMAVAVHAMRRTLKCGQGHEVTNTKDDNSRDKSILIYGLGTIGLFLLMFLIEVGYKNIYVVGNKESQRKKAEELGLKAENYIASTFFCKTAGEETVNVEDSMLKSGFDICFECVGKNETMNKTVELAKPGGTVCLVGNPHSDMSFDKKLYWKILRNQLTIVGTWNSSFTGEEDDDWNHVVRLLEERRITPEKMITHIYDLTDAEKGFVCMRDKLEDYIKIMIDLE